MLSVLGRGLCTKAAGKKVVTEVSKSRGLTGHPPLRVESNRTVKPNRTVESTYIES